jgi:hypothetical protein
MTDFIDVDDVAGLGEKFEELANLFRRFNFPNKPHGAGSTIERDYWRAVIGLYSVNSGQLDAVAQESIDEWNLQVDMGQGQESDEFYLVEFIRRVDVAIEEDADEILWEISPSQLALSQSEEDGSICPNCAILTSVLGRELDRTDSFATTLNGTPTGSRRPSHDESTLTSPVASMERLCMQSNSD